tara:strand:- start:298 stop:945 length:648 start_codon:yes stop_codon:yes gene_type:complete
MDDLTRIKGIGAATAKKLIAAGITSFVDLSLANHTDEPLVSIAKNDIEAVAWITCAAGLANVPAAQDKTNTEGKPLSSDQDPEVQLQDGASLPADSRAGDRPTIQPITPPESNQGSGNTATPPKASAGEFQGWAEQLGPDGKLVEFCPLVVAALREWADKNAALPEALVISSKREGFRRSGIAHPRSETTHAFDQFDFDDIERMLGEPVLTVRLA